MNDTVKAVIFDLDGTLLDTIDDLADSVNAALEICQYPAKSVSQIRTYVGNGIRTLIERSLEGGMENPDFEKVFQTFREHYKTNCQNKTKPYDGIMDLLRFLKAEGKKLAIVSNKADFAVKKLNQAYFPEFDMTAIGEREGVERKPAPDMVVQALQELGVSKGEAVYIGDSEVDIATASNAGLPCISVLWGFRSKALLEDHGAKRFARTPEDVRLLL